MDILNFILDLLIFIGSLSVLVLIHELGHFLAARRAGVKVEEFGFGFPPRIWGKKIGDTTYSINALPLGGFVRLYGEDEGVETKKSVAYYYKGKLARIVIVLAGVTMNVLLAILAFSIVSWHVGVAQETGKVKIIGISEGSPAAVVGLRDEDQVVDIDGQKISTTDEFIESVRSKVGKNITLTISRDQKDIKVNVTPRENPPQGQGSLGVVVSSREVVKPPLAERPLAALRGGVSQATYWGRVTVEGVASIFQKASRGEAPEGVAGPLGIFEIVRQVRREGFIPLITLIGILSVNLSILNALPIPALDGGRLFFIVVETFFGRRVVPKFERVAHMVGMILLLTLLILVTIQDVGRLIGL